MGINGDYMSLAEAAGETVHERGWVAGVDFDPHDADEMRVMELVWERERTDALAGLRRENADLRAQVAQLIAERDGGDADDVLDAMLDARDGFDPHPMED